MSPLWRSASARQASLVVALAATLPYLGTLDNYFVQDDFGVVWLLSQKPWSYFPRWFVSTWMDDIWGYTPDEIRPFPALSYQLAAVFGAASPVANHVINIAFHVVNGLLVLQLAKRAARLSTEASLVAALVFVLLPFQAETVAWVTGRVDSMPACFYLASFLLYVTWRDTPGSRHLYWGAVAMFFVALFTKQNVITLAPALVLFDAVVMRDPPTRIQSSYRYVPFVVLTLAYLALRYVIFGEVARESQFTAANIEYFRGLVVRHLHRTLFGDVRLGTPGQWALVVSALALATAAARVSGRERAASAARVAIYFGPIWWVIGVAPVIVAAYESPRHIYLASVGWAIVVGLAFDVIPKTRFVWRALATAAAAAVIAVYATQLVRTLRVWETRSRVSERAVRDLEAEVLAAREGTLIIAGAPVRSWEWAMPFMTRAPFVDPRVEHRVTIITPWLLHCCRSQWNMRTRSTLQDWLAREGSAPVVALRWDADTGARYRLSSEQQPYLRAILPVFLATDSEASLDRALLRVLADLPRARSAP